jgi:hypothetical protein
VLRVPTVPELELVDLFEPSGCALSSLEILEQLGEVHRHYFNDYSLVIRDWREQLDSGAPPPDRVVHAWLVMRGGKPVGEIVIDVNLPRGIAMIHFVAVHAGARSDLPRSWLADVLEACVDACRQSATSRGFTLVAVMAECEDPLVRRWQEIGYTAVDVDYFEPRHGRYWQEYGEPQFHDLNACIARMPESVDIEWAEIVTTAVTAFLVDHHQVPASDPRLLACLDRAASLKNDQ